MKLFFFYLFIFFLLIFITIALIYLGTIFFAGYDYVYLASDGKVYRAFETNEAYDANGCRQLLNTSGSSLSLPASLSSSDVSRFTSMSDGELHSAGDLLFPHFIPKIFISHYPALKDRHDSLVNTLSAVNIPSSVIEFRSVWNRGTVLQYRDKNPFLRRWITDPAGSKIKMIHYKRTDVTYADGYAVEESAHPGIFSRVANFLEHFTIYEQIIERNLSSALILEDDAYFTPDTLLGIATVLRDLQTVKNWDLVVLGTCLRKTAADAIDPHKKQMSEHLWRVRLHRCANGYLLSQNGARKLAEHFEPTDGFNNIDGWLEYQMGEVLTGVYWIEPAAVYEGTKLLNAKYFSTRNGKIFAWLPKI